MPFEGPMPSDEKTAKSISEMVHNNELLRTDQLTLQMLDREFTDQAGMEIDAAEWIANRLAILEDGIPQINPEKVAAHGVAHSEGWEGDRKLSEEGGVPDQMAA